MLDPWALALPGAGRLRLHDDVKLGFALLDYFPCGDAQEDFLGTAEAVRALGHEVALFCGTWRGPTPGKPEIHTLGQRGLGRLGRARVFTHMLRETSRQCDLDGLVAFDAIPVADIYYVTAPCGAERARNLPWHQRLRPRHRHARKLEAELMAGQPPHLILPAADLGRSFQRHYRLPEAKLHTVPPTLPPWDSFPGDAATVRAQMRDSVGTPPASPVVLVVGSFPRRIRLLRALSAAFAQSSNPPEVWHVGNPSARTSRPRSAGDIIVRSWPHRADLPRFFDAADILLHTGWREPLAKAPLYAARQGLAVVTTRHYLHSPYLQAHPTATVLSADAGPADLIRHLHARLTNPSAQTASAEPTNLSSAQVPRPQTSYVPAARRIIDILGQPTAG